jgi:hypothetical protein
MDADKKKLEDDLNRLKLEVRLRLPKHNKMTICFFIFLTRELIIAGSGCRTEEEGQRFVVIIIVIIISLIIAG